MQLPGVVVGQALAQVPGEQLAQAVGEGPVRLREEGLERALAGAQGDGRELLGGVRGDEDPLGPVTPLICFS